MAFCVEEEVRTAYLWWMNNVGEGDARVSRRDMTRGAVTFMQLHFVDLLLYSYLFASVSCIIIIGFPIDVVDEAYANSTSSGRMLKGGDVIVGGDMSVAGMLYVGDSSNIGGLLWLTLAASIFMMFPYCALTAFTPFEKLNIFMLSMVKMMKRDLMVFLILFLFFMADFYFALYILYPRAGNAYMPQVLPFNRWYNGIRSLFELAFTGSPSVINLDINVFDELSPFQCIDFFIWLVVYLFFIILSLILLLNLLIAMLSFTFESVRNESTLQCRTSFAQCRSFEVRDPAPET